jgi:hypothetical protein
MRKTGLLLFMIIFTFQVTALAQGQRWSEQKANDWYKQQPWLVGSNYVPATAINELEMWQADTLIKESMLNWVGRKVWA